MRIRMSTGISTCVCSLKTNRCPSWFPLTSAGAKVQLEVNKVARFRKQAASEMTFATRATRLCCSQT